MLTYQKFRQTRRGVPADQKDEIPELCWHCPYLLYLEAVCACPYYLCGYQLPDRLTTTVPACLQAGS